MESVEETESVGAEEMSEAPVSFVVGEPDPDPDPSEVQEIEDSFPSEQNNSANVQVQNNVTPGLLERRKRLRWLCVSVSYFYCTHEWIRDIL